MKLHKRLNLSPTALSTMSMDDIWATIKEHAPWYNSNVVEYLIRFYGDDNDKKVVDMFEIRHDKLIKFVFGNDLRGKKATLVLKLEESIEYFNWEKHQLVHWTVCDLMNTTVCSLDAQEMVYDAKKTTMCSPRPQEGCLEITMSILAEVVQDVFPFSPDMKEAFQKAFPTLISVRCGRFTEMFKVRTAMY